MIVDDRYVLVGSANLNDRSQLGSHDSEIAVIIEDPTPIASRMNGQPWQASKFATTLRRQLMRKHLGTIPPQDFQDPDANFHTLRVPNIYDFGSPADKEVIDPLSDAFTQLWRSRAKKNTEVFAKVFHCIPHDSVQTWDQYESYFSKYFSGDDDNAGKYLYGHVVKEDFPPGEEGVKEVKQLLSGVKGMLVEMPLLFLVKEDIAKEGLTLNAFTDEVYT
jgi:phospholipase D1/2